MDPGSVCLVHLGKMGEGVHRSVGHIDCAFQIAGKFGIVDRDFDNLASLACRSTKPSATNVDFIFAKQCNVSLPQSGVQRDAK